MNIKGVALRVGAALTIVAAVGLIGCNGDEPLATYTLMTTAEPRAGGSIIRSLNESYYEAGTKVTLTAVENTGYAFVGWDGAMSSRDKSITVTMNNNLTLTANFQREETGGGDTTVPKVTINGLTWMKKNLNIETPDSWCYNDSASYCAKYGRLYTWEAAKSACQSMGGGWRLPTREDWDNLVTYAGGTSAAGKKLKSKTGWYENTGTDDFGFSALPGGYRLYSAGSFGYVGDGGYWWSATESGSDHASNRNMDFNNDFVFQLSNGKSDGLSVRCVAQD